MPRDRFAASRSSPVEASSRAATAGRRPSQLPSDATAISSSPPSVIPAVSRPLAIPPSHAAVSAPAIGLPRPFPAELGSETGAWSPSQAPVITRPAASAAPLVVHEHPSYPRLAASRLRMHGADPMPAEEAQLEREADNLADQVVTAAPSHRGPKKRIGPEQASNTTGQPLDRDTRAFMEPRLGYDLRNVRVHTDANAARSARAIEASAYTVGHDIYFGAGQYHPGSGAGRRLLAHELAHTIQQQQAPASLPPRIQRQRSSSSGIETPLDVFSPPQSQGSHRSSSSSLENSQVIVPNEITPGPGQMREFEFLIQAQTTLNALGWKLLVAEGITDEKGEIGLGDLYVSGLQEKAARTRKSIETLVSETTQSSHLTAQGYLNALRNTVPKALEASRRAYEEMQRPAQEKIEDIQEQAQMGPGTGMGSKAPLPTPMPTPSKEGIRSEYPEISSPLAAALAPIPNSIWGLLSPLLQGLIFHSIISAGYVAGWPAPSHPLALVNRGGGVLGRRRTDLRDPLTGAVIEIKPVGDSGGAAQLYSYIQTLQGGGPQAAPWHAAHAIPSEEWPLAGIPRARYTLNPFGINFTLEAWNEFATEPGMLYYELVTTPGVPVYVPRYAPQPKQRFAFALPRIAFKLPDMPPYFVEVTTLTVATGLLAYAVWLLVFAV
jgi:Domain of unknown function (DUF4157)